MSDRWTCCLSNMVSPWFRNLLSQHVRAITVSTSDWSTLTGPWSQQLRRSRNRRSTPTRFLRFAGYDETVWNERKYKTTTLMRVGVLSHMVCWQSPLAITKMPKLRCLWTNHQTQTYLCGIPLVLSTRLVRRAWLHRFWWPQVTILLFFPLWIK